MIEEAQEVLKETAVELIQTRIEELQSVETFDLVLSHMCLQTIKEAPGFVGAVARFVRAGGIYVIAIPHPAFFNDYKRVIPPESFTYMDQISAEIDFSITLDPQHVIRRVPYTHRPLSQYFSELGGAGLSVLFLNEIFPSTEVQKLYGVQWEAPRYLVLSGAKFESGPSAGSDSMSHRLLRYR
jgi:SAM-dependent methyltransferase